MRAPGWYQWRAMGVLLVWGVVGGMGGVRSQEVPGEGGFRLEGSMGGGGGPSSGGGWVLQGQVVTVADGESNGGGWALKARWWEVETEGPVRLRVVGWEDGRLELTWDQPGYRLESALSLNEAVLWEPVVVPEGERRWTTQAVGAGRYFRLRRRTL